MNLSGCETLHVHRNRNWLWQKKEGFWCRDLCFWVCVPCLVFSSSTAISFESTVMALNNGAMLSEERSLEKDSIFSSAARGKSSWGLPWHSSFYHPAKTSVPDWVFSHSGSQKLSSVTETTDVQSLTLWPPVSRGVSWSSKTHLPQAWYIPQQYPPVSQYDGTGANDPNIKVPLCTATTVFTISRSSLVVCQKLN